MEKATGPERRLYVTVLNTAQKERKTYRPSITTFSERNLQTYSLQFYVRQLHAFSNPSKYPGNANQNNYDII